MSALTGTGAFSGSGFKRAKKTMTKKMEKIVVMKTLSFEDKKNILQKKIGQVQKRQQERWSTIEKPETLTGSGLDFLQVGDINFIVKGDRHNDRHGDKINVTEFAWNLLIQGEIDITTAPPVAQWFRSIVLFDRTPNYAVGFPHTPQIILQAELFESSNMLTSIFNQTNVGKGKRFQIIKDVELIPKIALSTPGGIAWVSYSTKGFIRQNKQESFAEDQATFPGAYPTNGIYRHLLAYNYNGTAGTNTLEKQLDLSQKWV